MTNIIIALLNTNAVMALLIGALVTSLVKWLATENGLKWKKWEGLAITAVHAAEKAIPDTASSKSILRLDKALKLFVEKYSVATRIVPNQSDLVQIESLISTVHNALKEAGTL